MALFWNFNLKYIIAIVSLTNTHTYVYWNYVLDAVTYVGFVISKSLLIGCNNIYLIQEMMQKDRLEPLILSISLGVGVAGPVANVNLFFILMEIVCMIILIGFLMTSFLSISLYKMSRLGF